MTDARKRQRGEGRVGAIVSLLGAGAVCYAAWNAAPAYMNNYAFRDKMTEIARTPKNGNPDDKIKEILAKQAYEYSLQEYLKKESFKVETRDFSRRLFCEYDREIVFLPGFKKTVHFVNDVDQPLPY